MPGVVPCCCDTSLDSPLSWPPPSPVLLPSTVTPCGGTAHATTVLARPPAAAPAGGCVACRVPAPGLPPSSPMPRGPPLRAPPIFPEYVVPDGNRLGADSCAPVGPTAASGPGFHVRWPPSGPRVSARAIPVSAGWRGPPADARFPPLSMKFFFALAVRHARHLPRPRTPLQPQAHLLPQMLLRRSSTPVLSPCVSTRVFTLSIETGIGQPQL